MSGREPYFGDLFDLNRDGVIDSNELFWDDMAVEAMLNDDHEPDPFVEEMMGYAGYVPAKRYKEMDEGINPGTEWGCDDDINVQYNYGSTMFTNRPNSAVEMKPKKKGDGQRKRLSPLAKMWLFDGILLIIWYLVDKW